MRAIQLRAIVVVTCGAFWLISCGSTGEQRTESPQRPLIFGEGGGQPIPTYSHDVPTLTKILLSPTSNYQERATAADTLGAMGADAREAVPTLIWALDDRDSYVRIAAATALGAIGADAKPAASALLTALENTEKHVSERRTIVEALGHIGDRQSVPKLVPFLEDPTIADVVAETIETLSGQVFMGYRDTPGTRSVFDSKGQLYIVVSARQWWEQTGSKQDWNEP